MFHPIELLWWWQTRANRPRREARADRALLEQWATRSGASPSFVPGASAEPELLVVLTTYARPAAATRVLERLGQALRRAGLENGAALLVLHDACGQDYSQARAAARDACPRELWLDARERFGKREFWRMHQTALLAAAAWRPKLALFLQDDVDFEPDLLVRALELWQATAADPLRRVLYLFSSSDDEAQGRWVHFQRREGGGCRQTNWFDLQAFLVDGRYFELLDFGMVPVHPNRWRRRASQSSGVGRQLTLRLFGRAHVYQAWPPLVVHGAAPSTMNPEARAARPLDNRADYVPSSQRYRAA